MRTIFLLLLLLTPFSITAQEYFIEGSIQDKNQAPLAYVNVGIVSTTIGTVSNTDGQFKLTVKDLNKLQNDTLRVSSIGFETQNFLVSRLIKSPSLTITMQPSTLVLNEVVVTPSDTKTYTEGKDKTSTNRQVNFSIATEQNQNLGSEIGKKFKLSGRKDNYLKSFKFFIKYNDFKRVKFRINVYQLDKGDPGELLNDKNLFVEVTDKKTGWITVDLTNLNLVVKGDIAIGAEWVEHTANGKRLSLPIIVPSIGSTHYYKYGSQSNWRKFSSISSAMMLTYEK